MQSDRSLHMLYVHSTALGYARYGVKLADALVRQGVKVDDHLDSDTISPKHLACWIATPAQAKGWFDGQRTVLSTMWEATVLPEAFRENLHNFDQILVPSSQNLELFSRYHPNVVKLPLGVDTQDWAYRERKQPTDRFVFLIGGSGPRKGQDLAYQAFRKVFKTWPKDMPVPHLLFKSPKPCEFVGERIEHVGGRISDEAERELYGMAHCYLQPSRGEGWGLQPLQAIAQGLPTILTDAHGHAEFAHLGYGISAGMSKADYFIYGDAGQWWEPSLDELCQQMEYVYYNYDKACSYAKAASTAAHEMFSWERCAERFVEAVGPEHFTAPYTGKGEWYEPEQKRYLARVLKPWRAEIAGLIYQFQPGNDYWEPADVKRILFEIDVLDPSCVVIDPTGPMTDAETGLTPDQLSRFGKYSASHSYCWSCHQPLNSMPRHDPEPV